MKCKYVPVEPTNKMIIAGHKALNKTDDPEKIFKAMLDAVPKQFNGVIGGLTGRQAQLYQFLVDWWADDVTRAAPCRREIEAALGWGASSVSYVLEGLERRGFVKRTRNKQRSIRLAVNLQ